MMGFLGIFLALGLLIWLAYRGWSVLLLCPLAALLAALGVLIKEAVSSMQTPPPKEPDAQ